MASERVTLTAAMLYDAGREDGRRDAAAEIDRLTSELEEAREQVRALREAILAELHGAGGIPVAEIGPDGVQRLWEVLVQTEVRNA